MSGRKSSQALASSPPSDLLLVPGAKLRRMMGVSSVTMWRWRNNPKMGFPQARSINGRNYFRWADVEAWLARQQQAA